MCPQVYKRVKKLPCCYETLVDSACLWQRSPLCGLEQNLCYQEKKRRKVWSTEGTNYRIKRFLLSQSLNKKKCAKEWWRHWIPRSLRAEDNHVWALENHVGGRPASQSSSRSLLLRKLGKWLNFTVLPLCRGCTTLSLTEVLSGINYHPMWFSIFIF